jgi:hypothetical protein
LQQGAEVSNDTSIIRSVYLFYFEVVHLTLDNMADVFRQGRGNRSPLHKLQHGSFRHGAAIAPGPPFWKPPFLPGLGNPDSELATANLKSLLDLGIGILRMGHGPREGELNSFRSSGVRHTLI